MSFKEKISWKKVKKFVFLKIMNLNAVAYGDFYSGGAKYKLNDYVTKQIKEFSSIFVYSNYHY